MIVFKLSSVKWRNYVPGPLSVNSWTCSIQVIKTSLEKIQGKSVFNLLEQDTVFKAPTV